MLGRGRVFDLDRDPVLGIGRERIQHDALQLCPVREVDAVVALAPQGGRAAWQAGVGADLDACTGLWGAPVQHVVDLPVDGGLAGAHAGDVGRGNHLGAEHPGIGDVVFLRGGQVVAQGLVAHGVAVVGRIQRHHVIGRDLGDVAVELVGALVPGGGRPRVVGGRLGVQGDEGAAVDILRIGREAEDGGGAVFVLVQALVGGRGRGLHIADDAVIDDGAGSLQRLEFGEDRGVGRGEVVLVVLVCEEETVQRHAAGGRAAPDIADHAQVGDVAFFQNRRGRDVGHGHVAWCSDLACGMHLLARGGVGGDHLVFDAARPPVDGDALPVDAHAHGAPVAIGEQAVADRAGGHGGAVALGPVAEFHSPARRRLGPLQHAVGVAVDDGTALFHAAGQGRQVAVGAFCTDGESARTHIARHLRIGVAHAVFVVAGGELADVETVGRAERGLYAHGRRGPAVIAAVAAVFERGLADQVLRVADFDAQAHDLGEHGRGVGRPSEGGPRQSQQGVAVSDGGGVQAVAARAGLVVQPVELGHARHFGGCAGGHIALYALVLPRTAGRWRTAIRVQRDIGVACLCPAVQRYKTGLRIAAHVAGRALIQPALGLVEQALALGQAGGEVVSVGVAVVVAVDGNAAVSGLVPDLAGAAAFGPVEGGVLGGAVHAVQRLPFAEDVHLLDQDLLDGAYARVALVFVDPFEAVAFHGFLGGNDDGLDPIALAGDVAGAAVFVEEAVGQGVIGQRDAYIAAAQVFQRTPYQIHLVVGIAGGHCVRNRHHLVLRDHPIQHVLPRGDAHRLLGRTLGRQRLHQTAQRVVAHVRAPELRLVRRLGVQCRLRVLVGRLQVQAFRDELCGLAALHVIGQDLVDAVARIGAPDAARVVVVVGFHALQRLAVVQHALLRHFAEGVVAQLGVADAQRAQGNAFRRRVAVRLVAQHVVGVGAPEAGLAGVAPLVVAGDGLPFLGQPALRVIGVVAAVALRIRDLRGVALGIEFRSGDAVGCAGRPAVAAAIGCHVGTGGVLGGDQHVAVRIALEFGQRVDGIGTRSRGRHAQVHGRGDGGTHAAQRVVEVGGHAAQRVRGPREVAQRVVGVAGGEVGRLVVQHVALLLGTGVDARVRHAAPGFRGLSAQQVVAVVGDAVAGLGVGRARDGGHGAGLGVFDLAHQAAHGVVGHGGDEAHRVGGGHAPAQLVVAVAGDGGARIAQVDRGRCQVAEGVVGVGGALAPAGGLACLAVVVEDQGLLHVERAAHPVVAGEDFAVGGVVGLHALAHGGIGQGRAGRRGQGDGLRMAHQALGLAPGVARVAGDEACGVHVEADAAGAVIALVAPGFLDTRDAHGAAGHGVAQRVVAGFAAQLDATGFHARSLAQPVVAQQGRGAFCLVHAHAGEDRLDLAPDFVVFVSGAALLGTACGLGARSEVAEGVVGQLGDDALAARVAGIGHQGAAQLLDGGQVHGRRGLAHQAACAVVVVVPGGTGLVGEGGFLAQGVVGVGFAVAQRVRGAGQAACAVVAVARVAVLGRGAARLVGVFGEVGELAGAVVFARGSVAVGVDGAHGAVGAIEDLRGLAVLAGVGLEHGHDALQRDVGHAQGGQVHGVGVGGDGLAVQLLLRGA
ncbi:hypothetical protein BW39_00518 [Delftia sp. RIT313]|nr:hypothetical protein BW39_00518 [Delftia sp. RIT313]